jgi:recombination associated protein RdgC
MFKKITAYKLTSTLPEFLTMEKALQCTPFVPTTGQQEKSTGWVPPRTDGGIFVESVNGHWMLRFMAETRRVPASVVKRRVDELAAAIEADTGRKPGKKLRRDMKEQAVAELLPNAYPRQVATWVWIDRERSRIVLDTTSAAICDDIITALVRGVDGLVVEPLQTVTSPSAAMAQWLVDQDAPGSFDIGKECELKSADETQAVVRYARHPLLTEEVQAHIATGKQPTLLALNWDGRVSFVLTDSLQLKKVVFADSVLEQSKAQGQRADDFDGNVMMLTAEIGPMLDDLVDALGGVAK